MLRPAVPADEDALYEVCVITSVAGDDPTYFDDRRLLGSIFVGPYIHLEPERAFAIDVGRGAEGYLLGVLDTRDFAARCESQWWPQLRAAYPLGVQRRQSDAELVQLIHHPRIPPDELLDHYPSHLHIDMHPRLQGAGRGPALLAHLLDVLRAAGSPGVHLGVGSANARAQHVYGKLGFTPWADDGDEMLMACRL
jgi:ribosomal protein S18 acetylase RimI-like enzyme